MVSAAVLAIIGTAVFAGASFFFSLAETSLFALGKWRTGRLASRDPQRGGVCAALLAQPQELLATIVLGNGLSNSAVIAVVICHSMAEGWQLLWVLPALLVFVLVGCEVIPKTLAVRAPEQWALRVARPMTWCHKALAPFHGIANRFTAMVLGSVLAKPLRPVPVMSDGEYRELIELACQQGTLAPAEREIILQIIGLDQRTVREVMRPRSQMACVSDEATLEEMAEAARLHRHQRLPIYDNTPDTIVGVLNARLLLMDSSVDLWEAVEPPAFVPESMNLLQLLRSFQRQRRRVAIVLDEFGTTAGFVSIEDILGEVAGQLRAETEEPGFVSEQTGPGRWRVSATMRIDDFRREYPGLGEVNEVETMGGLLVHLLGVVPAVSDTANFRGLKLSATAVDERRVRELIVETIKPRGTS